LKFKVLTYNEAGYKKAVKHAKALGAISRDGDTKFKADKTSLVIDKGYMMQSRAGYAPKKQPYDAIVTLEQFKAMASLTALPTAGNVGVSTGVSPAKVAQDVAKAKHVGYGIGFDDGEAVGYAVGHDDGQTYAAPQKTLRCTKAKILVANPVIWKSMGIPFFEANGIDIVEADGKSYTIDIATNDATEFTAKSVAAQAEKDLLDDKDTIYTQFVKNFDLADELVFSKVLPKDDEA